MTHPVEERRSPWRGMLGVFLLTAVTFFCTGHHVWAGHGREGIIDGRNPADFNGAGHIDSLKKDQIVINDTSQRLSPHVKYYKPGRIRLKRSSLRVGTRVGYVTNSRGEIISLWLIPETRTPRRP